MQQFSGGISGGRSSNNQVMVVVVEETASELQEISSSLDIQELSYTMLYSSSRQLEIKFYQPANFINVANILYLQLTNSEETEELESEIRLPTYEIEPPGDFVYEEGKDLTVKITFWPFDDDGFPPDFATYNVFFDVYLINEDREELERVLQSDLIQVFDTKNETGALVMTVRLNTARYNTSGIIKLGIRTPRQHDETEIVHRMTVIKDIVLCPSFQAGPFPEGFLGVMTDYIVGDHNDTTKDSCIVGEDCDIWCMAVGEDISEMSMARVESDGSRTPMEAAWSERGYYGWEQILLVSSVSTGTDLYECRVENSVGKVVVQRYEIMHTLELEFLEDQSEIRTYSDNDASTVRRLAVVCTVRGYPLPQVAIEIYQGSNYHFNGAPDEITEIDNTTITATKFVTYDSADPYGHRGKYKGKLFNAICHAQSMSSAYFFDKATLQLL